jgi:adenylylsulfate kinase
MTQTIPVLLITGPVGVGKTSVGAEVSTLLERAGLPHAFVDMDHLRWCPPAPPGDRFNVALGLRNLAAVSANYRVAGAQYLILADVLEARADLALYEAAIPGALIRVVRLRASVETLTGRVRQRDTGEGLAWSLDRTAELAAQMERDRVEDLVVETDGRSVPEVAQVVLDRCGWLPTPPG